MVAVIKFSQFSQVNLNDSSNMIVGWGSGNNFQGAKIVSWTTATRPVVPLNGVLGYNTDFDQYEYWDAGTSSWAQIASTALTGVTSISAGIGLTTAPGANPITSIGILSFSPIAANSLWANTSGILAVPTVTPLSTFLLSANNLSDISNIVAARVNLGVPGTTGVGATGTWPISITGSAASAITATTATNAVNVGTTAIATNAEFFIPFVSSSSSGNQALNIDADLHYNPSTNTLTAGTFNGAFSGTVTNAANVAITDDNATNATVFPTWVTANTGNLPEKVSSTKMTFNPSTGLLTTTAYSGSLAGATGLPISTGVAGLGAGIATFLGTPTSANLAAAVTNETGTGALVFANSPTLTGTPVIPTPFTLGAISVTATGTQLNLLSGLVNVPITTINVQRFLASGTYTPTANMKFCIVEGVSGGGAGGSISATASIYIASAGGAAGGYVRVLYTAAQIGVSKVVTLGAGGTPAAVGNNVGGPGGTTTFGATLFTITGGGGGGGGASSQTGPGGQGGVPTVSSGIILSSASGMPGCIGLATNSGTILSVAGNGASSPFGGGGQGLLATNAAQAGTGFGSGGSGVADLSVGTIGGAGTGGYIVVTEFISS